MIPLLPTVSCVLVMFLLHFAAGISPVLILRCCKRSSPTTDVPSSTAVLPAWINCFAGGVFIAMCFLGLLPYAEEQFAAAEVNAPLPLAQLCVVAGIFFVLFLEAATKRFLSPESSVPSSNRRLGGGKFVDGNLKGADEDSSPLMTEMDGKELKEFAVEFVTGEEEHPSGGHCHSHGGVSLDDFLDGGNDKTHSGRKETSIIFLFLAINLHAFFEGMALGLQTETQKLIALFIGILVHELITAFALGVSVARKRFGFPRTAKYILSFSASIPAGIAVGVAVSAAPGEGGKLASAVLQAFSAGVLLHVIFMEIIPAELGNNKGGNFWKIFYFLLGFIFMGCLGGLLHLSLT